MLQGLWCLDAEDTKLPQQGTCLWKDATRERCSAAVKTLLTAKTVSETRVLHLEVKRHCMTQMSG